MKKKVPYKIDNDILKNYAEAINSIKGPMNQIKELIIKYPNDHAKIYIDIMKQIMCANHGMLSVRMIEPLNISRQYLSIMENK